MHSSPAPDVKFSLHNFTAIHGVSSTPRKSTELSKSLNRIIHVEFSFKVSGKNCKAPKDGKKRWLKPGRVDGERPRLPNLHRSDTQSDNRLWDVAGRQSESFAVKTILQLVIQPGVTSVFTKRRNVEIMEMRHVSCSREA